MRIREVGDRHAPRLAARLFAAGYPDVTQVGRPAAVAAIADQELAAPHGPVGTEAGAVEGHAYDRLGQAVLRQAGRDVRVVVLHAQKCRSLARGPFLGEPGGRVVEVQVVDQGGGTDGKEALIKLHVADELLKRLIMVEVAHVVAEERLPATAERERRF